MTFSGDPAIWLFTGEKLREKIRDVSMLKVHFIKDGKEFKKPGPNKNEESGVLLDDPNITNPGLFRYYAESYLKNHPLIDGKQTLIVCHKKPEGNGLPVQIYAFSSNNSRVPYEHVQSEIFEHLISILGEFELKVFQQPTGNDILSLTKQNDVPDV